ALHLLHDLRSDDDTEPASGARRLCDRRCGLGVRLAIRAVQAELAAVGAVAVLTAGAGARSTASCRKGAMEAAGLSAHIVATAAAPDGPGLAPRPRRPL